ncbi:MAG: hypothetical protein ABIH08_02935 [Candidatus Omnitrophota bacterium]
MYKRKTAFTLVELVMTIVVVSIIGIPLSALVVEYINGYWYNDRLSSGSQLARSEQELLMNTGYDNINSAFFSQYQGYPYDLQRTVTYQEGDGSTQESLKKIEVIVYSSGTNKAAAKLTTYRAKNVLF